jgi:hypothetical protein
VRGADAFDPIPDGWPWIGLAPFVSHGPSSQILQAAIPAALGSLGKTFLGAEHVFETREWAERFAGAPPAELIAGIAMAAAALDYHSARQYAPGDAGSLNKRDLAYLHQRVQQLLSERAADVLRFLAVLTRIPSEWLPARALEERLSRSMREAGATGAAVAITFQLPSAGGGAWLRHESQIELSRIVDRLSAGHLCPLILFTGSGSQARADAALAYATSPLKLHLYIPLSGRRGEELELAEIDDGIGSVGGARCAGLLTLDAQPVLPRFHWFPRFLRSVGLSHAIWQFVRRRRRKVIDEQE